MQLNGPLLALRIGCTNQNYLYFVLNIEESTVTVRGNLIRMPSPALDVELIEDLGALGDSSLNTALLSFHLGKYLESS